MRSYTVTLTSKMPILMHADTSRNAGFGWTVNSRTGADSLC